MLWETKKQKESVRDAPYGRTRTSVFKHGPYTFSIREVEGIPSPFLKVESPEELSFSPEAEYDPEENEVTLRLPELSYQRRWLKDMAKEAEGLLSLEEAVNKEVRSLDANEPAKTG